MVHCALRPYTHLPNPATTQVALPELDGALEPIVFAGRDSNTGKSHSLPDRVAALCMRAVNWARLRKKANAEKKLAVTVFSFPPDKGNVGTAAYLNVFGSIFRVLKELRKEGYDVGLLPSSEDELIQSVLQSKEARFNSTDLNVAYRWGAPAPVRLQAVHASSQRTPGVCMPYYLPLPAIMPAPPPRRPVSEYTKLCEYSEALEENWGKPPGTLNSAGNDLLIYGKQVSMGALERGDGGRGVCNSTPAALALASTCRERRASCKHPTYHRPAFVPACPSLLQFGNVFIGVQPTFGYEGDPMRLLFSRSASPHHGFAAYYTFLEKVFKADAVLHFGTHGSLEFMPGKQVRACRGRPQGNPTCLLPAGTRGRLEHHMRHAPSYVVSDLLNPVAPGSHPSASFPPGGHVGRVLPRQPDRHHPQPLLLRGQQPQVRRSLSRAQQPSQPGSLAAAVLLLVAT